MKSAFIITILLLMNAVAVQSQTDSLKCDVPYVGRISSLGEFDLISFSVAANEILSITIVASPPAGMNFLPSWRIVDRNGNPATSCGSGTIARKADCGPLPTSGNPYRIEVADFFNDDIGNYRILLQHLTFGTACENIPLKCDIPFTGTIDDSVDSDLLSFTVPSNEWVRIIILNQGGSNFLPTWRILDASGKPTVSCGSGTISSQTDCGPLPTSGNPYRIEISDFFNDGKGTYIARFNFLASLCPPPPPILVSPLNGATGVSINPTFSWNASNRATSYQLQVSLDPLFSTFVVTQSGITGTSFVVSGLLNDTQFYWRVNASNTAGTSDWSTVWNFKTTIASPPAPSLAFPRDDSVDAPTTLTLGWNAANTATSYQVQLATNPSFSPTVRDLNGIAGTSILINGLVNNALHYWRVRASNAGGTGVWSNIRKFTTIIAPPNVPSLVLPSDGAINQPKNLILQWRLASRATLYQLQVALDPNFAALILNMSGIIDTSAVIGNLDPFRTYYWWVRASNKGGVSAWSSIWRFTTDNTVGVSERDNGVPTKFNLGQNYPNPFNPSTIIKFSLPRSGHVTLKIFDLLGKEVATLVDQKLNAGQYEAQWDATSVESGMYFYQLRAEEFVATKKLMLMK